MGWRAGGLAGWRAGGLAGWQTDLAGVAESSAFLKMHTLCSLYHVAHPIVCMPRRCRALREAMDYPQAPHPTSPERTAGSAGHSAAFGAGIHPQAKAWPEPLKTPAMPQLAAAPRAGVRRVFNAFFLTQTMVA